MASQLEIRNLHVRTEEREILRGVDLVVRHGELHALMGPNGSGKSTLANTIMGHPGYEVTDGEILFDGENITELAPHERAKLGLFLAFQYPVAIPGVSVANFLRLAINAQREEPIRSRSSARSCAARSSCSTSRARSPRATSTTASRAARRSAPRSCRWRCCARRSRCSTRPTRGSTSTPCAPSPRGSQKLHDDQGLGVLIITHYQRILDYVRPEFVHIMMDGRIVMNGGNELVERLEREGYDRIREEVAARA